MQLSILFGLLLTATSVSALDFGIGSQVVINEDLKVPGDNPLQFCSDPSNDILEIESVDLSPNPPKAGEKLSIVAKGHFKEDVEEGAKVHLQVKWNIITLINQEADLCDKIKEVGLECPLKKGDLTFTHEVSLPAQIPPGKYTVLADVFTKDKKKITCLEAHVQFP